MRQQFVKSVTEIARQNSKIIVLLGDIGAFGFRHFAEEFPGRLVNAGIREQAMVSCASGLAVSGLKPVIHTITPFLIERAFEQIKIDFGYQKLSGCFVSVGSGYDYSALGCTHHSYGDVAMMRTIPGCQIFVPGGPSELDAILQHCLSSDVLSYIRIASRNSDILSSAQFAEKWTLGRCRLLSEGNDALIFCTGGTIDSCLNAARNCNPETACTVVHAPTIHPIDTQQIVELLKKRPQHILTVEDHSINGGLGDEIRKIILENNILIKSFKSFGVSQDFIRSYGKYDDLLQSIGSHESNITAYLKSL